MCEPVGLKGSVRLQNLLKTCAIQTTKWLSEHVNQTLVKYCLYILPVFYNDIYMLILPSTNILAPLPPSLVGSHFVDSGDAVESVLMFSSITQKLRLQEIW